MAELLDHDPHGHAACEGGNTREPIRDERLRGGLVRVGAVVTWIGLPTASSRPRYALQAGFASLFNPALEDEPLQAAIASFTVTARVPASREGDDRSFV